LSFSPTRCQQMSDELLEAWIKMIEKERLRCQRLCEVFNRAAKTSTVRNHEGRIFSLRSLHVDDKDYLQVLNVDLVDTDRLTNEGFLRTLGLVVARLIQLADMYDEALDERLERSFAQEPGPRR
jgi:hypothetical protein